MTLWVVAIGVILDAPSGRIPYPVDWVGIVIISIGVWGGMWLYSRGFTRTDLPPAKVAGHAILGYLEIIIGLELIILQSAVVATSLWFRGQAALYHYSTVFQLGNYALLVGISGALLLLTIGFFVDAYGRLTKKFVVEWGKWRRSRTTSQSESQGVVYGKGGEEQGVTS